MLKGKRTLILITLFTLFVFILSGCAGKKDETAPSPDPDAVNDLTLEELAEYNGKDGNPAYIAVDGIIYDVSRNANWKNGEHNGYGAGKDVSEAIEKISPHGKSVLKKLPVVGNVAE
ncbi:MAG: hypothetical protein GXY20_11805 [Clostridiales bacterium]|jgi:predicted heme/steroid binding protein|nr:hypothetical protein [Clostridiales bacterium]